MCAFLDIIINLPFCISDFQAVCPICLLVDVDSISKTDIIMIHVLNEMTLRDEMLSEKWLRECVKTERLRY